jgi:hypothetical protein
LVEVRVSLGGAARPAFVLSLMMSLSNSAIEPKK